MTKYPLLFLLVTLTFSLQAGLLIVDNHRSTFKIIIPANPASQEKRAAEILQEYIHRTANCKLPIANSDKITTEDAIIINSSPGISDPDGFTIQTIGNQLFITGGSHKGCIYGVIDLLEKQLGCRKYSVDYEVIPSSDMIYLPDLNYRDAPVNQVRIINGTFCQNEDYCDWQRLYTIDELFPKGYYVHTFHRLIPWEDYFEEHPDWFALMNGKRIIDQPCLSNPEMLKITLNKLGTEMILQPDKTIWSVSQNDNFSYCQCDACKKIIREEGSPAGPIIRFVNEVATKFPDKTISTLAYQYSRKAPLKTKPLDNVQVMLCTIELNRSKPIREDASSESFMKDMEAWGKICNHIYLWDYSVNFNHHVNPFPNLHILQSNIQLFTENNIHEHFQQSNTGNGHEFSELKSYLISRLLWNPDVNADSVLTEFLNGYYGEAGHFINQYIHLLSHEMEKSGDRLDIYEHPTAHQNSMLSMRNMNEYNRLFDQAEKAVKNDPTLLLHIQTARLSLQYAIMEIGKNDMFGPRGWYTNQGDDFILRNEMAATLEQFIQTCHEAGVQTLSESGLTPDHYYETTKRFINVQVNGNLAFRNKVTASPLPAAKYSNGDLAILTNGVFGANDFKAHWLGWEGENFTLDLDLGQVQTVDTLQISTLWDQKSWIFHPASITCLVSEDGTNFREIGEQTVEGDQRTEPVTRTFLFTLLASGIRDTGYGIHLTPNPSPQGEGSKSPLGDLGASGIQYIRFQVSGLLKNPDWHPSAGGACWVFVDEIVVR
ncbi:MAG: DUF4838 domain-containing protein [Bacteroidales bacterium]|nr:DUF4838 domain-containing protein [Bacteroidales bacterium]